MKEKIKKLRESLKGIKKARGLLGKILVGVVYSAFFLLCLILFALSIGVVIAAGETYGVWGWIIGSALWI